VDIKKVLFIGGDPRIFGSVEIRCQNIALRLGCDRLFSVRSLAEIPRNYSVFVCVKAGLKQEEIVQLGKRGLLIWDMVDDTPPKEGVQIYLASTQAAKQCLNSYGRVEIIPHHHCNIDGFPNSPECRRPGWVGQLHWCPKFKGFEYDKFSTAGMTSDQVAEKYRRIGIGLNLRAKNRPEYESHIRMNTGIKLINCIGFGIPSISGEEPAYHEIGEQCTIFSNLSETGKWVRRLQTDTDLYLKIRQNCLDLAPQFHITEIVKKYRNLLQSL
jgi:hypothetical protein